MGSNQCKRIIYLIEGTTAYGVELYFLFVVTINVRSRWDRYQEMVLPFINIASISSMLKSTGGGRL